MKTITTLTAMIASYPFAATAQETADPQRNEQPDINAGSQVQVYSQAENITRDLPLDLLAVNNPGAFTGIAILDSGDDEIGTITAMTRSKNDQALHAIVSLSTGTRAAIALDELSLAALAYYDPAQALSDQLYEPADFAEISQYQAGHSARGSLTNPAAETSSISPANPAGQPAQPGEAPRQTAAEQQAQADLLQSQTPGSSSAAETSYITSGSPIIQLALTNPEAMRGKQLLDEAGKPLGEINHIAKNNANQELYAVINMDSQHGQTVVKLDALSVGKLAYLGDIDKLSNEDFAEEEFVPVAGQ